MGRTLATAAEAAAYEDFLRRFPAYAATTAVDELRAADYARLDRLGHTYLDYTGGGLYAESQLRRHHELLAGASARQSALAQPDVARLVRARQGGARRGAALLQRARGRVRDRLHAQRQRRPQARRRGVSVRARRRLPAQLRQPQLRQRHPRVRLPQGRRHDLHPGARVGPAARRGAGPHGPPRRGARGRGGRAGQALRVPGAVQLQRRPAPARVGRRGARPRLGRPARLRRVRADQPARRGGDQRRLHSDLVLQALRLPDRRRLPDRPPRGARQAAPPVVRRRHDHARLGAAGGLVSPGARGDGL